MAKETLPSEKRKNDQDGLKEGRICTRSLASLRSTAQKPSGLRRSCRQAPSQKSNASPSSTRKSERLEKQAPTPPSVTRKSKRIEKKNAPSPLRRSDRGKNVSSSNLTASKKPCRNSGTSSNIEQRKDRKEKSVQELTNDDKQLKTRANGRPYKSLFSQQPEKSEENQDSDMNRVDDFESNENSAKGLGKTFAEVAREDSVERGVSCSTESIRENGDDLAIASTSFTVCGGTEKNADSWLKRKRSSVEVALDAPGMVSDMDGCIMSVEGTASPSGCKNCDCPDMCNTRLRRRRVKDSSIMLGDCSCSAKPDEESNCMALQDRGVTEAAVSMGFEENIDQNVQQDASLDCKSHSSRFAEYWVPVQISNIQLEQYCMTLLSNSLSLCSISKKDHVGALHDILVSVRKTCDHPYVVNDLKSLLTKNLESVEYLDVDIKASGKLELLDSMLTEIRKRSFKAVVLYQTIGGSGRQLIGDFLDDFVRQRFGPTSYERVEHDILFTKKQNALNKFNEEAERFVLLLETRACNPRIKLSSVGAFILFDSSWNPLNDLRALEKIKVESESERTKIFRLYSACTVEEKALVLARQNKTVDGRENLNLGNTCALLMWGASYLFDKLENFHSNPIPGSGVFSEQSVMEGVINEFLSILSSKGGDKEKGKLSLVLEAKQFQGAYGTDSPLFGEEKVKLPDEDKPHIFWTKLLKGKSPRWKYCSFSSQRNRKRPDYSKDSEKDTEVHNVRVPKKRKKTMGDSSDLPAGHDEEKACRKGHEGALGPPSFSAMQPSRKSVSGINNTLHGSASLGSYSLSGNISEIPLDMLVGNDGWRRLHESQKSLHADLKPEMAKLCRVLNLSEKMESTVDKFLEYVISNYRVCKEPTTALQAFQIATCWTAALLLKQKINHKESLVLAKDLLLFDCTREEVEYIYSMLCCMKSGFLEDTRNLTLDCLSKDSEQGINSNSISKRDIANTLSGIKKKFGKQAKKLLEKHEEEKKKVEQDYVRERSILESKKKVEAAVIRIHISACSRLDRLKNLDSEYEKKFDELKRRMEKCLENLEKRHTAALKKLTEWKAHWIERIQNWAQAELLNQFPGKDSNNNHGRVLISSNTSKNTPVVDRANDGPTDEVINADTGARVSERSRECLVTTNPLPKVRDSERTVLDEGNELDVAEVVASNNGPEEDVLPVTTSQQHLDNLATEHRPDGLPRLIEPEILAATHCREKSVASNSPLPEDQVRSGVTSTVPGCSEPDQVVQSACPSSSAGNVETQNITEAAEPGVPNLVDRFESGQPNQEGEEVESDALTERLHSVDASCGNQNAETLVHRSEHHVELAHEVAVQPSTSNYMLQSAVQATPQIPFPFFSDPFLYELERIRREQEKAEKIHAEERSELMAECERKIAEIVAQVRLEYGGKLHDVDNKFHAKIKDLESNKNYIVMNKYLADAFKIKCVGSNPSTALPTPNDANSLMQQISRQSLQFHSLRSPTIPPRPSGTATAPPSTTPAISSIPHFSGPPSSSPLHPMPQARPPPPPPPPLITNVAPSSRTTTPSHGIVRMPAPHLQSFRPSSSPRGIPTKHSLQNPPTTLSPSTATGLHAPRPPSQAHQNSLKIPNVPVSAAELVMDASSRGVPSHTGVLAASAFSPMLIRQQLRRQQQQQRPNSGNGLNGNLAEVSESPDVVCLSDDE